MTISKKESQKIHFIEMAWNNHNLFITNEKYERACTQIKTGKATFLKRKSARFSEWLIKFDDFNHVIYDKKFNSLISIENINDHQDDDLLIGYLKNQIISKSKERAENLLSFKRHSKHIRGIISIGDPGIKLPIGFSESNATKLRLEFQDLGDAYGRMSRPPKEKDVKKIIRFGRKVLPNLQENQFVLVHCQAGIGRSSATAYILRCMLMGKGKEYEAIKILKKENPFAMPNALLIRYADKLLGREGEMIRAIQGANSYFGYELSHWVSF